MSVEISLAVLDRSSLADYAFDFLSAAIVRGEYRPGDTIRDGDVAAQLGTSRAPIREAIMRLEATGLVAIQRSRYTRVASFRPSEFRAAIRYTGRLAGVAVGDSMHVLSAPSRDALASAALHMAVSTTRADRANALVDFIAGLLVHLDDPRQRAHLSQSRLTAQFALLFYGADPSTGTVEGSVTPFPGSGEELARAILVDDGDAAESAVRALFEQFGEV